MKQDIIILLILVISTNVCCYCPWNQIHAIGICSYRIQCVETIKDIRLDKKCYGSSNNEVKIEVILRNATDTFHLKADSDFISMITTLVIVGNWPRTDLPFLESMHRLRNVYLSYNNMEVIMDSPFRELINLETIDLSHNKISVIDELLQFEHRPFKMQKLSLAYNSIKEVPGDAFEDLTSLLELDLSYNHITELSEEPFRNLTNLQILKLNNNNIIDLNGALDNLINLEHLYLGSNQIEYINEESLKTINHLLSFDVANNKIDILDPVILVRHWGHFNNNSICRMIISGNNIISIYNATLVPSEKVKLNAPNDNLKVTTELDLSKNVISDIDYNAFQSIDQLVTLDLSNNKLLTFTVNSTNLMYIKFLNLSCNYLTRLYYNSFSLMHNLQNLDLSHNAMDYLPDQTLSNSYKIKYLNVTYNDISEVNNLQITFHSAGGVLDLSNNRISILNIPINEALGLTELILSSNNITDAYLIKLVDQRDLTRIDMSKNFIQELDESSLQLPVTLGYLDLRFNKILIIRPSAFHHLGHLKTLKLSHNNLKVIEHGIFRGLTSLMNLDLSYNEIQYLDSKVFMDLKSLSVLSVKYNSLNYFEHDIWLYHKNDVKVYIDGNDLSCEWLAKALNDHNNGYSKMYPAVIEQNFIEHSIEGIPCRQEVQNLIVPTQQVDERLLITNQKILEAVQEQTSLLRKYIWHSILQEAKQRSTNEKN